eukprot:259081_1
MAEEQESLIQEIIQNEKEYRKYIKTQPGGQNTCSNKGKPPNNIGHNNNGNNQNNNSTNKNSNNENNNNETNKDEEEKLSVSFKPERIPKEDPGDGLPSKPPAVIEFKWMETKKQCVTQHMLYLLQLALNLIGRTVILQLNILNYYQLVVRNKYFKSIGRTDRFINQLDNP